MKRKSKSGLMDLSDVIADFDALIEANKRGIDPLNKTLPSGRTLHNPAKRKVKSADRWAKQQIDNAKAASSDWLDGVKNPARDPVAAALDAEAKMFSRYEEAKKAGKWKKNLAKVKHSDIIEVADKVGTGGFETGIEARRLKIEGRVRELQPLVQSVSDSIQALPDATDADREKRLLSARKLMLEVGKRR